MAKQQYVSVNQAIGRSGYAKYIAEHLSNEDNLKKIQALVRELSGLFQQLSQVTKTLEADAKRDRRIGYLARTAGQANDSLSVSLNKSRSYQYTASQNTTAQQLIKRIFLLEHKILDTMTNGATKTAEYVIYYNGKNKGEVRRGVIAAKDVYSSDALAVDKEGNVILKQTVTQLNKFKESTINAQGKKVSNLTEVPEYQEIAKIIAAYLTSISEQYNNILAQARETHLGFSRDRMHDALRQVNSEGESVETYMRNVYARYINAIDSGQVNIRISGLINRGHLVEAYENLLRYKKENADNSSSPSYVHFLQMSLGNDPWYIGGDVGGAQVKSFMDNASSRQVASLNSIMELGRRLIQLVTKYEKTMSAIKKQEKKFTDKINANNSVQNKLDNFYEEEINMLVQELTGMLTK